MLNIHPAILTGLGICFILLIWTLWEGQVVKRVIKGLVGVATLYIGNLLLPTTMMLEINYIHIVIVLVFGLPGAIILFISHYVWNCI